MAEISTVRRVLIYARKCSAVEPTLAAREAASAMYCSYEEEKRALAAGALMLEPPHMRRICCLAAKGSL